MPIPLTVEELSSSPARPAKKSGRVRWAAAAPEEDRAEDDCSRQFDELYYSSVVTSHKKTDRGGGALARLLLLEWHGRMAQGGASGQRPPSEMPRLQLPKQYPQISVRPDAPPCTIRA